MKTIIISGIMATLLMASPATAQATDDNKDILCPPIGRMAEVIMRSRQNGVIMSDLLATISPDADPKIKNLFRAIAIDAYKKSRYSTAEYQQTAIEDFRNDVESMCYSSK